MDTLELYLTSELFYREVANRLGMNNPALIVNWMRIFRTKEIDGLSKSKGQPPTLPKKKEDNKKIKFKETPEECNHIKELEKQVRSIQTENAFLKELSKLRKQEAQQR
ncbi:Mobile element protein [Enterococcus mundtii 3F]|nr:Mobile element protein [Enterococcus mundtii 3F]